MFAADYTAITAAGIAGTVAFLGSLLVYMRGKQSDEDAHELAVRAQDIDVMQQGIKFLREENAALRAELREMRMGLIDCEERDREKGRRIRRLEEAIGRRDEDNRDE